MYTLSCLGNSVKKVFSRNVSIIVFYMFWLDLNDTGKCM